MMEEEVVRRRRWLSRAAFLDLVGATHLIPGPNSTELAIHIGFARARWAGLLVAGLSFIAPAMAIVWLLAWGYVRFGSLPAVEGMLGVVKPVVIAVVAQALWGLGRTALKSAMTLAIFAGALLALWLGTNELAVLAAAAIIASVDRRVTAGGDPRREGRSSLGTGALVAASATPLAAAGAVALVPLFLVFLKAGALLFGSGYVLFAFLEADLVDRLGWLSRSQLLDAIAVGQVTPGPVFTSATFIGFLLAGHAGAAVATIAIFLPAFLFVALSAPALERWRDTQDLRALLDGVNAAALAMMLAVTLTLSRDAFLGPAPTALRVTASLALFGASLWLLVARRVNATWLLLGGALTGLLASAIST